MNTILSKNAYSKHADDHYRLLTMDNNHYVIIQFRMPRGKDAWGEKQKGIIHIDVHLQSGVHSLKFLHDVDRREFWDIWVDWRDTDADLIMERVENEIFIQKL